MKEKNPPKWALRFLRFFCKEHYLEQIEGDLLELFEREPSKRKFAWNTIRFFRWRYVKGLDDFEQLTTLAMVKNYLKVAIRTLIRQKSFAGINIAGLAIGLASCMLIMMYIFHERSYDNFYPDIDRMYRVANGDRGRYTPPLLASTMMKEYAGIEAATKINGLAEAHFKVNNNGISQEGGAWADEHVFKVFNTEFISGDKASALVEPNSIVLTSEIASKYFPDHASPIGEIININGDDHKITGVVKNPPKNTHFPYKYIISNPINPNDANNWSGNSYWTYAKLTKGTSHIAINEQLKDLYKKYVGPEIISFTGHSSFEELEKDYPDRLWSFTIHPVRDIHLETPSFSMASKGDKENILIFSLVALFILLIACINYINMATARSTIRSKEVGIRKTLGSHRKNIVIQFLVESLLITTIAIILSFLLAGLALNTFNYLTDRAFSFSDLLSPTHLLFTSFLLIFVGLLAGVYPALVIANFSPLKALKGTIFTSGKSKFRNGLVIFQFAISVFLIATTLTIYTQLKHMQSKDLGVNIDQVLVINNAMELGEKYDLFKDQLNKLSTVEHIAKASGVPFRGYGDWSYAKSNEEGVSVAPYNAFMEYGSEKVLGITMKKGRFFKPNLVSDTASVVINETLQKELGWDDPIGKKLKRPPLEFRIIGVMEDFNFGSMKREVGPIIFRYGYPSVEVGEWHQQYVMIKIQTDNLLATIEQIEALWDKFVPNYPFDSQFLDESFEQMFSSEQRFGQVFTAFSSLAIFIAFMGLFALTTFILRKRFKEIAIRKVLGASTSSLIGLMLKNFTFLVILGGLIGCSVAFYWLNNWLESYSYRIELAWYLLAMPIIVILALTWVVVSTKSYKASIANPSNALKEE